MAARVVETSQRTKLSRADREAARAERRVNLTNRSSQYLRFVAGSSSFSVEARQEALRRLKHEVSPQNLSIIEKILCDPNTPHELKITACWAGTYTSASLRNVHSKPSEKPPARTARCSFFPSRQRRTPDTQGDGRDTAFKKCADAFRCLQ